MSFYVLYIVTEGVSGGTVFTQDVESKHDPCLTRYPTSGTSSASSASLQQSVRRGVQGGSGAYVVVPCGKGVYGTLDRRVPQGVTAGYVVRRVDFSQTVPLGPTNHSDSSSENSD